MLLIIDLILLRGKTMHIFINDDSPGNVYSCTKNNCILNLSLSLLVCHCVITVKCTPDLGVEEFMGDFLIWQYGASVHPELS